MTVDCALAMKWLLRRGNKKVKEEAEWKGYAVCAVYDVSAPRPLVAGCTRAIEAVSWSALRR